MQLTILMILVQVLIAAASPAPATRGMGASSASLDCTRATSPRERLICRDPTLSERDRRLGDLYRQRRALLSPQGARALQASERGWLKFIATVCPLDPPSNAGDGGDPKTCLSERYDDRLKQLLDVGRTIGPFRFNRIDLYAAEPASVQSGAAAGFYVQHVAYPQIDSANTPDVIAWNARSLQSLPSQVGCDSSKGDDDINYAIGDAGRRLISVEWDHFVYCHGTAHGRYDVKIQNTVMSPHLRELSKRDVFGPGDNWVPKLQDLFWRALFKNGWWPPENQPAEDIKHDIEDEVVQPQKWLFKPDGLQVSFDAYDGGCYACTPQPVTLSWTELKPLLSKAAIAP